ncbi:MAG: HD-GYP domain-containing protein [Candidatus Aminicenantales bacterium]
MQVLSIMTEAIRMPQDEKGPFCHPHRATFPLLPSFFPLTPGVEEDAGYPSWPLEAEKMKKVSSARKILRDLSRHYEAIFQDPDDLLNGDFLERQAFLNSNLLYLIEATDGNEDTLGHSQLVSGYMLMLAKALGIEDKQRLLAMERGALLHDIGKIGIPESILRKAGPLTAVEKEVVKEHPLIGYGLLEGFHFLEKPAQVVLYHHESYDGSGYPFGLAEDEIPLEARIFALADTLDAITSDRPYRRAKSFEEAFLEIEKGRATQFDPLVVDAFFSVPKEKWQQIKARTEEFFHLNTVH